MRTFEEIKAEAKILAEQLEPTTEYGTSLMVEGVLEYVVNKMADSEHSSIIRSQWDGSQRRLEWLANADWSAAVGVMKSTTMKPVRALFYRRIHHRDLADVVETLSLIDWHRVRELFYEGIVFVAEFSLLRKRVCETCSAVFCNSDVAVLRSDDRFTDVARFVDSSHQCLECTEKYLLSQFRPCPDCGICSYYKVEYSKKPGDRYFVNPNCGDRHRPLGVWYETRRVKGARVRSSESTLTDDQWLAIVEAFDRTCAYCQVKRIEAIEHILPTSKDGGTTHLNCVPSCTRCNVRKKGLRPEQLDAIYGEGTLARIMGVLHGVKHPSPPGPPKRRSGAELRRYLDEILRTGQIPRDRKG